MMGLGSDFLTLADLRKLDMVSLLGSQGFEPVARKKNDTDHWYLSPLRNERTASFHVNRLSNEWYDFGLAAGGNPVDFLLRYHKCSVAALLERMNVAFSPRDLPVFDPDLHEGRLSDDHKLLVRSVKPLYAYPLKNYLHERSIPVLVADAFCKEVSYELRGRSYYGIGFQNDAGGWEIRNKNYKLSSAPKDITSLSFGARSVHVFEGFMDLLSYRALHPYEPPGTADLVVLNGAGLFDRALPFLLAHERVHLWLDRDVTGLAYRDHALSMGPRFVDESEFYEKFKDLNDWLRNKGEVPKVRQRTGLHPV